VLALQIIAKILISLLVVAPRVVDATCRAFQAV
jgi:hypothetical protein